MATEWVARTKGNTMPVYRYQTVCVGWWRGKIKRWNTTFHSSQSNSSTSFLHTAMNKVGYPNPGDTEGACSGGLASISVYALTGGAPVNQAIYFDWQTPSEWIPYTGEAWAAIPEGTPLDASGESAAVIVGKMSALSSTGKPVTTRKYLHAIPSRSAADYADPDIDATTQAAIVAAFSTTWMANPEGVSPLSLECEPYYLNHQRVRGRRRTVDQVAAQSFSAGVVAGATSGGGASASQFR